MARSYAEDGAWRIDAAALSSMAAVKTAADKQAVSRALDAIYKPWLEAAARHLQLLEATEPGAIRDVEATYDANVESGTVMLFADGLRFDLAPAPDRAFAHTRVLGDVHRAVVGTPDGDGNCEARRFGL